MKTNFIEVPETETTLTVPWIALAITLAIVALITALVVELYPYRWEWFVVGGLLSYVGSLVAVMKVKLPKGWG